MDGLHQTGDTRSSPRRDGAVKTHSVKKKGKNELLLSNLTAALLQADELLAGDLAGLRTGERSYCERRVRQR
jgi:hypothetical protein